MSKLAFDSVGEGAPIVLLHAFPFSRRMWQPQRNAFAPHYRVLTPDFAGFGDSAGQSTSIDAMADDIASWLDAVGEARPIVLGGCSMGGYVALAFARRHAARLRALLLIDTKAEPDDDAAKANRNAMLAKAEALTAAAVTDGMMLKALGAATHQTRPDVVASVRAIGASQPITGILAAVQALRDRPDARPGLVNIHVPTLVLVGEQDAITPPSVAKTMANAIASSRLVELPQSGHLPNLEVPDLFNSAVLAFLQHHQLT